MIFVSVVGLVMSLAFGLFMTSTVLADGGFQGDAELVRRFISKRPECLVQRNAMKAFQGEGQFRALLAGDADVSKLLSSADLDEAFDLEHSLRFAEQIVDRAIRA